MELPRFRGRGAAFALRDDWVSLFIADRQQIVQAGMPPVRVVPAFDEVEDGHPGLDLGREAPAVQQLALEGGKEALAEGIDAPIAVKRLAGRRPHRSRAASAGTPHVRRSA